MLKRLSDGRFVATALAVYALLAIAAGAAWRLWWTAPSGMVYNHVWLPGLTVTQGTPYLLPDPPQDLASSTPQWAILALAVGLIGGVFVAWAARGREFLALATTFVGAGCAGFLMLAVGYLRREGDPRTVAVLLPDGATMHDRISLASPWLLVLPLVVAGTVLAAAFLCWAARPDLEGAENVGATV